MILGSLLGCLTGVNDAAYISAAGAHAAAISSRLTTETAIQVALTAAQYYVTNSIAKDQEKLGNRRVKLAEAVLEHAEDFWPEEKSLLNDAFNSPEPEVNYGEAHNQIFSPSRNIFVQSMEDGRRRAKAMCSSLGRFKTRGETFRARVIGDAVTFAYRHEEAKRDALSDVLFSRRYTALGIGKGMLNNVNSFADVAAAAGLSAGQLLAGTIQSGMEALGYYSARSDEMDSDWQNKMRVFAPYTV